MTALGIRAHAKFNPVLRVGRLRTDGFHEVDTILQALELHDVVTLRPSNGGVTLTCSDESLSGESNLAWKALRLASEIIDLPHCAVHIEKHIPQQAGLGGGSSDTAAVLRLLDASLNNALSDHLLDIGAACGSDVCFFLGASARAQATGKGERLSPLIAGGSEPVVIAMPAGVRCSTEESYSRIDALRKDIDSRPDSMPLNDFERVAPPACLEIIDELRERTGEAGLCGSGSAVYALSSQAGAIASELRSRGFWAVATHTITSFGAIWTL